MHRIRPHVPTDPERFTDLVVAFPERTKAYHEEGGLYRSPELKLLAAATTTIMASRRSLRSNWERLRNAHAEAFIAAHPPRTAHKIVERIGHAGLTQEEVLPDALVQARVRNFGLPQNFGDYHDQLQDWADQNAEALQGTTAWQIYEAVARAHH